MRASVEYWYGMTVPEILRIEQHKMYGVIWCKIAEKIKATHIDMVARNVYLDETWMRLGVGVCVPML